MGYIIYQNRSKILVGWKATERGAKISLAAWNRRSGAKSYSIMEEGEFDRLYNKKVLTTSLMTGKDVYIREQDKGGCCDPATETYWSM